MNLQPTAPKKLTPEELLEAVKLTSSLALPPPSDKRVGWTYFNAPHAIKTATIILKLNASKSRQAVINTSKATDQPGTIRARIVQGKAYLSEKGTDCLKQDFTTEDIETVKAQVNNLEVSIRRATISLRLKIESSDYMDALTIVDGGDEDVIDGNTAPFNEEVFRVELINFVNNAAVDTQMEFTYLPKSAVNYAKAVALQDDTILVEQIDHLTVVMKLTPEARAQLMTP
jgi:hypothetical protein